MPSVARVLSEVNLQSELKSAVVGLSVHDGLACYEAEARAAEGCGRGGEVGVIDHIKASKRASRRYRSLRENSLLSAASSCKRPGPNSASRPRLPNVPTALGWKAAAFKNCSDRPHTEL